MDLSAYGIFAMLSLVVLHQTLTQSECHSASSANLVQSSEKPFPTIPWEIGGRFICMMKYKQKCFVVSTEGSSLISCFETFVKRFEPAMLVRRRAGRVLLVHVMLIRHTQDRVKLNAAVCVWGKRMFSQNHY